MTFSVTKCTQVASMLIIIICIEVEVQSLPINRGFSIKFNPALLKEELPNSLGSMFVKVPQEPPNIANEVFSNKIFHRSVELATGCSNQIARILFPTQGIIPFEGFNYTTIRNRVNFINVPVLSSGAGGESDYKILVVSAPHNVKLGRGDAKSMLVYIVFPSDNSSDDINIPSIFFVNKSDGKLDLSRREKVDPILIIDNNRTVTGLKSKEISKFVRFKNKYANHFNVDLNH